MNIFKRIFKVGQAETNSLIDKLENPIKLTEQGIRDMKRDLEKSLQALAEVKAMAIRAKREADNFARQAVSFEKKAIDLLEKAKEGLIDSLEADRLAENALTRKQECDIQVDRATEEQKRFNNSVSKLEINVKKLKLDISKWENELKTLRARARVSEATVNVNKQMARIDTSGTISMLERMKEKVEKNEALAESYENIVNEARTIDEEIDKALNTKKPGPSDALLKLKEKINNPEGKDKKVEVKAEEKKEVKEEKVKEETTKQTSQPKKDNKQQK